MTWTRPLMIWILTAAVCGFAVAPAVGEPANAGLIAIEQLGGSILSVAPQIPYQHAVLRVSGPGGYALTRRFQPGTPIAADLLTEAEIPEGAIVSQVREVLPDGRYRFELVLTTPDREALSHAGMFFVERGTAVPRPAKRDARRAADLEISLAAEEIEVELLNVDDRISIEDTAGDGWTWLEIESDSPGSTRWRLENQLGDLLMRENSAGFIRMTVEEEGQVGIGTSTPLQELHIDSPDGGDIRLSGSDADWILGISSGSNEFVVHDETTSSTILRLAEGAPANSLVVAANGRVGIGTATPAADFDVQGHVHGTTFRSASSRALKTGFQTIDPAEMLQKVGELPLSSWHYRSENEGERHIGPVAEDFQRLFDLGDGATIATVDVDGVLLAAIQGLHQGLQSRDQLIAELSARVAKLELQLEGQVPERTWDTGPNTSVTN